MGFLFSICLLFQEHFELNKYQQANVCSIEHTIRVEASKNNIKPELLAAVVFVESSFYPRVTSSAGACGLTQVIPGWTYILQKMVVGDKWEVTIPAELAYGAQELPDIPANSTLIFIIELVDIID